MNTLPTIPSSIPVFSFQRWRDRFLRIALMGGSIFGLIGLVQIFFTATNPLYTLVYSSAYLFLLIVTLITRLPYRFRAGTFLLLLYTIGLSRLFETGIWGDARLFFLALVIMSGLLFSPRAATAAIVVSSLSLAVLGWFTLNDFYRPTSQGVPSGEVVDWVTGTAALMLLGAIVVIGLHLFMTEFGKAQERAAEEFFNLQDQRRNLGDRVAQGTDELERTANLLRASAIITQKLNEIKDIPSLLNSAVNLISEYFSHYHVGIFLSEETHQYAVLQASSSTRGKELMTRGYRVEIGDASRVGSTAASGRPNLATGAGMPNAEAEVAFPRTQSELVVALTVRDTILGTLDVHSDKAKGILQGDLEIFESLAGQIAASLENVRLLSETQSLNLQLESLAALQTRSTWQGFSKRQIPAYQVTAGGIKAIEPGSRLSTKRDLEVLLRLRGQEIGRIALDRTDRPGEWTGDERDLLEKIATQVALACENNRLLEETRRRAVQEQMVSGIAARFSRILDVDTLLQTAAREFGSLPDVSEALVLIREGGESANSSTNTPTSQAILNTAGYRSSNDRLELVVEAPLNVLAVLDASTAVETRIESGPGAGNQAAIIPIRLRGQVVGVVRVQFNRQRPAPETVALIEQAADRLATSIENARLVEETRQRSHRDALVSDLSNKFRSTLDLDAILKTAAQEFQKAFQLKEAEVLLGMPNPSDGQEGTKRDG